VLVSAASSSTADPMDRFLTFFLLFFPPVYDCDENEDKDDPYP
jgi:hypothetical protein